MAYADNDLVERNNDERRQRKLNTQHEHDERRSTYRRIVDISRDKYKTLLDLHMDDIFSEERLHVVLAPMVKQMEDAELSREA